MQTKELLETHAQLFEPTTTEQALLKLHEQHVQFEVVPVVGISEGRQSRVSVLEYKVGDRMCQVLWKRMGAGKGLAESETKDMHARLSSYSHKLSLAGWNIPTQFYTKVVAVDGEHQIFSYEQFVGNGDARFMVANPDEPNFRKWNLMRQSMETVAQSQLHAIQHFEISGKKFGRLSYGIDLKLDNLVLDESGKLWFVDLFGIKELNDNGEWEIYSEKLDLLSPERLLAVCATREGVLLRFIRLMEYWWNKAGMSVKDAQDGACDCIDSLSLSLQEKSFVIDEIKNNYPWLDSLYAEKKV